MPSGILALAVGAIFAATGAKATITDPRNGVCVIAKPGHNSLRRLEESREARRLTGETQPAVERSLLDMPDGTGADVVNLNALGLELVCPRLTPIGYDTERRLDGMCKMLEDAGEITDCHDDYRISATDVSDVYYRDQMNMRQINLPGMWAVEQMAALDHNPVVVALLDTGIDLDHPDLEGHVWTNPGEIPGDGIDNDNNGFIDDVHGWNFHASIGDPLDDQGHGTHCAGIVGGIANNSHGIVGVGVDVRLMSLKILDNKKEGYVHHAMEALNYAIHMGAQVSSHSWGACNLDRETGWTNAVETAATAFDGKGHLVVASSGNCGANIDDGTALPCTSKQDNMVCVAATDENSQLTSWSNYGRNFVDVAAPGLDVLSTTPGGTYSPSSGTSMSAPHVTGLAAQVWHTFPELTANLVKQVVLDNVDQLDSLYGKVATSGRINACKALRQAAQAAGRVPMQLDDIDCDAEVPEPAITGIAATESGDNIEEGSNTGTLIGSGVGIVLLAAIVVMVGLLWRNHRKAQEKRGVDRVNVDEEARPLRA